MIEAEENKVNMIQRLYIPEIEGRSIQMVLAPPSFIKQRTGAGAEKSEGQKI